MIRHKFCIALLLMLVAVGSSAFASIDEAKVAEKRDAVLKNITGAQFNAQLKKLSITSFGAKGDGKTNCKPAFDKAMKKVAATKGGAQVVVPKGIYYIDGPINLVSNVTLEIQEGATLKFSENAKSYPVVETSWEGTFVMNYSPFIYGRNLQNVALIGKGTIDGNAAANIGKWKPEGKEEPDQMLSRDMNHKELPIEKRVFGPGHYLRPQLVQLYGCKNVTVDGLKFTNSPFWCLHLLEVDNAIVRNLKYEANKILNNNGVTLEYASNILVENNEFNNADDNVSIKCGRDNDGWAKKTPSKNIVVRNCKFKGLHAVVFGSEVSAGIQNVFVENCTYAGYCKRGIFIKTNPDRGGYVRDIFINNCEFGEVTDLFYVTSMYSGEGLTNNYFADVHGITVQNLRCKKARNAALVLQGSSVRPIYDVRIENVEVEEAKVGFSFDYTRDIEMSNCYVGGRMSTKPSQLTPAELEELSK